MKIKLLIDLPVSKEHGMTKDRILEVVRINPEATRRNGKPRWYVMDDAGEEAGVLKGEAELCRG